MSVTRRDFLKASSAGLASAGFWSITGARSAHGESADIPAAHATPGVIGPDFQPRVVVMGVGGAGFSVDQYLRKISMPGVTYVSVSTDLQALTYYDADVKLFIGQRPTRGLGNFRRREYLQRGIDENREQILEVLAGADLVIVVNGLRPWGRSWAAPMLAGLAREAGALTVGVVTESFRYESRGYKQRGAAIISELVAQAHTTVVMPMDGFRDMLAWSATLYQIGEQLFQVVGDITSAIINMVTVPGLTHVSSTDVCCLLANGGRSAVGTGAGHGRNRVVEAAHAAVRSPLLARGGCRRSGGVLVTVRGDDVSVQEQEHCRSIVCGSVSDDAPVLFGYTPDRRMRDKARVTLIASAP